MLDFTLKYAAENYEDVIAMCEQDQEERWFVMDCFDIDFLFSADIKFVLEHVVALKALEKAGLGSWQNLAQGVPENIGRLINAGYDEADVLETAECELGNRSSLEQDKAIDEAIKENRLHAKLVELFPEIDADYVGKLAAKMVASHHASSN